MSLGIYLAYILTILSVLLCVIYGIINWNKGDEPLTEDDLNWVKVEDEIEKEFE
ncbi:MAG TPA: hypothetical protein PKW55_00880 [Spirochaetota bacterium]|nr:hypothetical protein [Spirochaetota bacterium]